MEAKACGYVTFMSNKLTLVGNKVEVGDKAPDFKVMTDKLAEFTIAETVGPRIFTSFPSIDTPVCSEQIGRFHEESSNIPDVAIYAISADLPFATKRWAEENQVDDITFLSDYRDMDFANNWGVHVAEARLVARAVFVVDSEDKIVHAEVVPELTAQPDIDKAIEVAKSLS